MTTQKQRIDESSGESCSPVLINDLGDLIDETVKRLDRHIFRYHGVLWALVNNGIVDDLDDEPMFPQTPRERVATHQAAEAAEKLLAVIPADKRNLWRAVENSDAECVTASEEKMFFVGLVVGLKMAGIPSDLACRMAKTWTAAPTHTEKPDGMTAL